jgi:hypothetical protein
LRGPLPERRLALDPALVENPDDLVVRVQVVELDAGERLTAQARVQQQHDDGRVAAASKSLPAQLWSSRRRASSAMTGTGWSGTMGGFMRTIGFEAISSSSSSQP